MVLIGVKMGESSGPKRIEWAKVDGFVGTRRILCYVSSGPDAGASVLRKGKGSANKAPQKIRDLACGYPVLWTRRVAEGRFGRARCM